jgi:broad specificity phosphatase PhoE
MTFPQYRSKKSLLDWQPTGVDYNGNPGESIRQVRDTRVRPVLQFANEVGQGSTVALSTHAEWMRALRAYYLGFDDARFGRSLVPRPPHNNPALLTSKMVANGQSDMFACTCTSRRNRPTVPLDHADIFRTVITDPKLAFDSGWLKVRDM